MVTLDTQLEDLAKKHAAEVEVLTKKHALAQLLPVPDGSITYFPKCSWVSYKAKTLTEALDILEKFSLVEFQTATSGCTAVGPFELMKPEYQAKVAERKYTCLIDLRRILDTPAPSGYSSLKFWAKVGDQIIKVNVDFGEGYIGCNPKLSLTCRTLRGEVDRWYVPHFTATVDRVIYWQWRGDSAHVDWLFSGEDAIERLRHAAKQLEAEHV